MNPDVVLKNRKYYQNRLKVVLPFLNVQQKRILDLGCGEGLIRSELENKSLYLGIEQFNFQEMEGILVQDIFDFLQNDRQHFDLIICLGVADHLNPERQLDLLKLLSVKHSCVFVLSRSNPRNPFLLYKNTVFNSQLKNYPAKPILNLYILKLPLFQKVWCFKKPIRWATEIISFYQQ